VKVKILNSTRSLQRNSMEIECFHYVEKRLLGYPYGPSNPHLGQRYGTPILRQRAHRQIMTSPQLGQTKATPFSHGSIGLPQLLHTGSFTVSTMLGCLLGTCSSSPTASRHPLLACASGQHLISLPPPPALGCS
jgi:hypothetical protein